MNMTEREWNIEPGDIVTYVESWDDGTDEDVFAMVIHIHLGDDREVQWVDVKLLYWETGEPTLPVNVTAIEGIWHLAA
jgi:hypothetical protein